jgi:hypothetical protein
MPEMSSFPDAVAFEPPAQFALVTQGALVTLQKKFVISVIEIMVYRQSGQHDRSNARINFTQRRHKRQF